MITPKHSIQIFAKTLHFTHADVCYGSGRRNNNNKYQIIIVRENYLHTLVTLQYRVAPAHAITVFRINISHKRVVEDVRSGVSDFLISWSLDLYVNAIIRLVIRFTRYVS